MLANAVDDRTMAISHVIRGRGPAADDAAADHAVRRVERGRGEDLPLPAYAHLPLLVNERGKKLSKRRDPVAVEMYREQGYLPAAFRNYLALLGWSPGDEEIVPIETIMENFRLEDVQRSPAFFDVKKLSHINGVYIRTLPVGEFRRGDPSLGGPGAGGVGGGRLARPGHGGAGCRPAALAPRAPRRRDIRAAGRGDPGTGGGAG